MFLQESEARTLEQLLLRARKPAGIRGGVVEQHPQGQRVGRQSRDPQPANLLQEGVRVQPVEPGSESHIGLAQGREPQNDWRGAEQIAQLRAEVVQPLGGPARDPQ